MLTPPDFSQGLTQVATSLKKGIEQSARKSVHNFGTDYTGCPSSTSHQNGRTFATPCAIRPPLKSAIIDIDGMEPEVTLESYPVCKNGQDELARKKRV